MTLRISISPEVGATLHARAAAAGVDVETYAARHLELLAGPSRSIRELSGPVADAVAAAGLTEDELADFLETEKHAARDERRGRAE